MSVLGAGRVMAIIRYRDTVDLPAVADELTSAGIPLVEITLDTPGALPAIRRLADEGMSIGAGTVRTADEARAAAGAGAAFVVTPGLVPAVLGAAASAGVVAIPGVLTPTELLTATDAGAAAVKIFPVGAVGGPAYIRALRGPFGDVDLVPTGGIAVDEVGDYLEAGAACVGLGSALVGAAGPTSPDELAAIGRRAAAAMGAIGA
ncbi:MAG TPA: bifunctional 4-hydroxy-2-oxoglutarate aldolase/2-dehydro-3-deoxy-phosphogluconate aldolase [Actinomycetota bacterium]|nr:bifunctional 4-hydroxy-2-oxoglutarate aldolase/2-dehydro-3-deoxy-phosphogluconate aldolase [Actinomycetota bacterium]